MVNKVIEQSIYGSASIEGKKHTVRAQWTPLIDSQAYGADMKYSWDATKSTRWNQDAQREDESRRFDEMLRFMQSIQNNKTSSTRTMKESLTTSFISPGGIYCRIENEWRTRQNNSLSSTNNTNANKNRQRLLIK